MKNIEIYTDGACSGNPGPGGYGVVLKYNNNIKKLSEGFKLTTNNRMEILAVIIGLESLKEKCNIKLFSDSKYVIDAINKGWAIKWKSNNWKRNKKDMAQNIDLWDRLLNLIESQNIEFIWVKGHAGHYYNEICDKLAVDAYCNGVLIEDTGYKNI